MGSYDESRIQLRDALVAWDYSSIFPANYNNPKGVVIVKGWPFDIIDNMLAETSGVMTQPILSMELQPSLDRARTLGSLMGGAAVGHQRFGKRVEVTYVVGCWADEQLGGPETVEALAGQVQACVFYNEARLFAYRHLKTQTGREIYEDRPQLWRIDVHVTGDAIMSYDI